MLKQIITLSAVAVLGTATLAMGADRGSDGYVMKQIPQGGSRFTTILVPVDRVRTADEAPYALTGRVDDQRVRGVRESRKVTPSHPRGTHHW